LDNRQGTVKSFAWCRHSRFSFNVEGQLQVAELGESMDRKRCTPAVSLSEDAPVGQQGGQVKEPDCQARGSAEAGGGATPALTTSSRYRSRTHCSIS
jgi:hypothetical protein